MDAIQFYEHELAMTQGELAHAYMAILRVRELHKPSTGTMRSDTTCINCDHPYPCPTILILDGEVDANSN